MRFSPCQKVGIRHDIFSVHLGAAFRIVLRILFRIGRISSGCAAMYSSMVAGALPQ
jgi:hypothetical protein